jgi:hypothetical protein
MNARHLKVQLSPSGSLVPVTDINLRAFVDGYEDPPTLEESLAAWEKLEKLVKSGAVPWTFCREARSAVTGKSVAAIIKERDRQPPGTRGQDET